VNEIDEENFRWTTIGFIDFDEQGGSPQIHWTMAKLVTTQQLQTRPSRLLVTFLLATELLRTSNATRLGVPTEARENGEVSDGH